MNEELRKQLDEMIRSMHLLRTEAGAAEFDKIFAQTRSLAKTPEERKAAGAYLREQMKLRRKRPDVDVKKCLSDVQDIVSLSYIAKQYFNRDRSWLYHRINGSSVNGKPAAFTEQELTVLSDALQDIGLKLSEISTSITRCL